MRIVCWNIERGYHPSEVGAFLRDLEADVYLLYEVDRGVKRTGNVDVYARLGDALGLEGWYATEFREIESMWRRIIPWGGPGGGEIGNAVFSRWPILDYRVVDLPVRAPLTYERRTWVPELFQPRAGCRKAQVFRAGPIGGEVVFASAHLELWRSGWLHRRRQLESAWAATQEVARRDEPRVVAGDFNSVGGSIGATALRQPGRGEVAEVRKWLRERGLMDPFRDTDSTAGRLGVRAKIDWLAASSRLELKAARKIRTAWSDHDCLVVDYAAIRAVS